MKSEAFRLGVYHQGLFGSVISHIKRLMPKTASEHLRSIAHYFWQITVFTSDSLANNHNGNNASSEQY